MSFKLKSYIIRYAYLREAHQMITAKDRSARGTKLEYTFKSDVLFKMLFVNHPDLLKRLVAVPYP